MDDKRLMPGILPQPADYSPEAIRKSVNKVSLTHPLTLYPSALGLGCAAFAAIANLPSFYIGTIIGLIASSMWLVVQRFFRSGTLGKHYLSMLDKKREEYKINLIEQVKIGIDGQYETDTACEHAQQGSAQFGRVRKVRDGIQELLTIKLNTNELTFHRFLAASEQAYLSILDNLKDVIAALKSANSIDPEELQQRIKKFGKLKVLTGADREEKEALEERVEIWEKHMERVDCLLAKNEKAITAMEGISARISEWQTDQHFAASDIESVITELHDLAQYAHKLNTNNN